MLIPFVVAVMLQPWVRSSSLHAFDFQRWVEVAGLSALVVLVMPSARIFFHWGIGGRLFFVLILLLLCVFVGFSSASSFLWVGPLRSVLYAVAAFGFVLTWRRSCDTQKAWFAVMILFALIVYCIYFLVGSFSLLFHRVYDRTLAVFGFSNVNHAAGFFMLSLLLLPGLAISLNGYGKKFVVVARAVGIVLAFLLAIIGSRGALLACLVVGGFLMLFYKQRIVGAYLHWLLGTFAVALLAYLVFRVTLLSLHIDFFVGGKAIISDSGRFELYRAAWLGALDSPWFGHGPLSYAALPSVHLGHAHNVFLTLLYEYGLPLTLGVVALCLWAVNLIWRGRAFITKDPVAVSGMAGLIGFAAHAQFSGLLMVPATMFMALVACAFLMNALPRHILILQDSDHSLFVSLLTGGLLVSAYLFLVLQYWQVVDAGVSQKPRFWLHGGVEEWVSSVD
ncbi:O-antigen ligase family protein [Alcanivorax sp. MM125-6]|nr:O-antigen ligase family protein [Alcanivorax sp. MM125-6]